MGLSLCWMLQVVLYLFVYPPVTPFLNVLFIRLDNVFPLFGVIAFALFCFWLLGESMLAFRDRFHVVWLRVLAQGALHCCLAPLLLACFLLGEPISWLRLLKWAPGGLCCGCCLGSLPEGLLSFASDGLASCHTLLVVFWVSHCLRSVPCCTHPACFGSAGCKHHSAGPRPTD